MKVNPNLKAAGIGADMMVNALAQLRYTRDLSSDARGELLDQIRKGAEILDALAFGGYNFAWDRLAVFRSELFRLGIAQDLLSFEGQSPESSIRSNP